MGEKKMAGWWVLIYHKRKKRGLKKGESNATVSSVVCVCVIADYIGKETGDVKPAVFSEILKLNFQSKKYDQKSRKFN